MYLNLFTSDSQVARRQVILQVIHRLHATQITVSPSPKPA
jgi:hypothetical protein